MCSCRKSGQTGILRQAGRYICKFEERFLVRTMFFFPQSCKVKASSWRPHRVWGECPQDTRGPSHNFNHDISCCQQMALYQQPHSVTSHIFSPRRHNQAFNSVCLCSSHSLFYVERAKYTKPPHPLPPMKFKASRFKKVGPKPHFQLKIVDIEHCSNKLFLYSCGRYIIPPNFMSVSGAIESQMHFLCNFFIMLLQHWNSSINY